MECRKNQPFCDTSKGAEASLIAYSILETAKANGLNLEKCLMHIFTVLPDWLTKDLNTDIEDLLPWMMKSYTKRALPQAQHQFGQCPAKSRWFAAGARDTHRMDDSIV